MGRKEVILFGCGNLGYEALRFLGEENVKCFCDNNCSTVGIREKKGKHIIPFHELVKDYKDYVVVLCVVNDHDLCDLAEQCEENGVYDYLAYTTLKEMADSRKECLEYIYSSENRLQARKKLWKHRVHMLEKQVEYFRNHADIRYMKPAEGQLRAWQMKCVKAVSEWMKGIEDLGISPFLIGGNLIGYVRHNGFVPWDDDIDFGLIRSDYEKLKNYCKENLYTREALYEKAKVGGGMSASIEDCCWECYPGNFVVFYKTISIDFFVYDYYSEDISFDDMKLYADEVRKALKAIDSIENKVRYLDGVSAENRLCTVGKSKFIYFGIDNIEMEHKYHKGSYIPENVIFPLKRVLWEGEEFFIPNDSESFLGYEFENIWEFPEDVGIPKHLKTLGIDENMG